MISFSSRKEDGIIKNRYTEIDSYWWQMTHLLQRNSVCWICITTFLKASNYFKVIFQDNLRLNLAFSLLKSTAILYPINQSLNIQYLDFAGISHISIIHSHYIYIFSICIALCQMYISEIIHTCVFHITEWTSFRYYYHYYAYAIYAFAFLSGRRPNHVKK